jgi:elongation factor Ts
MMDCKRALTESSGDLAKAVEVLRERGLAKAGKREGRATSEGVIAIATTGTAGGIVEIGCETDFVARTDDFIALAARLAQIAAEGADSVDAVLAA